MIDIIYEDKVAHLNYIDHKLYHKQAIKFKAFLINIVLMLLCVLLCKSGLFDSMIAKYGVNANFVKFQAFGWMALWKVANIVFFLVPALSIWWERKCIEHHRYRLEHDTRPMRRK